MNQSHILPNKASSEFTNYFSCVMTFSVLANKDWATSLQELIFVSFSIEPVLLGLTRTTTVDSIDETYLSILHFFADQNQQENWDYSEGND